MMRIKNNSNIEWKDYDCGWGEVMTIKPNSIFEVSDKIGKFLIHTLGAPNWLTVTDEPLLVEKKTKVKEEVTEEVAKPVKKEIKKNKK